MLYLADDRSSSPELLPARALLTPTWVGALALLVANDHWLKGSGLLPGVVTGKLSDFAGMLVAPTLLAALIGVRSRGALLACHLAVAAVFTGIQLSTEFAAQWSALMGVFGHPWTITCDPTDLIALPFLLLSWKLLVPQMNPQLPALVPLQRTAVGALSVFGLWSTVATSDIDTFDGGGETWYEDVWGHLYINNANDFDIALHIRPLRSDVELDCEEVSADPGRLLDESAFGEAVHWSLPPRTNVSVELSTAFCGAVWIAGEGIEPRIVFIPELDWYTPTWFPGQSFDASEVDSRGLAIEFGGEGSAEWIGDSQILFVPKTESSEQPSECEPSGEELRIDWPLMVPNHDVEVLAVEAGVDGCFELELQEVILTAGEPAAFGEPYGFYLCAPAASVPVVAGEFLRLTEVYDGYGGRELTVMLLDGATLEPQVDDNGLPVRRIRYMRGVNSPALLDNAVGRTMAAVDRVSCQWEVEGAGCATVDRPVDIGVFGESTFLQPSSPVAFGDGTSGMVHELVLAYARQLAVLDLACTEGSTQLSYDIDIAIIDTPL